MNLNIFIRTLLLLMAASLLGYAFNLIGIPGSPIDSFWKLMAFCLGIAIVASYIFPLVRGVRRGDQLAANVIRQGHHGDMLQAIVNSFFVTALEGGRIGSKIKVRLANNRTGEGVILAYAGSFTPAQIRLTESEL